MNRRNFLGSLAVLPFFGSLVKGAETKPKKVIMSSMYGTLGKNWDILNPQEIIDAGFALVTTPAFIVDDQAYCIKTKKMALWLSPENLERFLSGDKADYRESAIKEIKGAGITHVYSVAFNPSPIYDPITFKSLGHMAFVRGAKIYWYPGSIFQKASCEFV